MDADEALKRWAAHKLGVTDWSRVTVYYSGGGGGCPSCGYGGEASWDLYYDRDHQVSIDQYNFEEMLTEVIAFGMAVGS